jgi:DNA-binding LacI/PurR family transcriptional regulator
MHEIPPNIGQRPTIYDVARPADAPIVPVSQVRNGHGTPRQETRNRVLPAVAEFGFMPGGARARAGGA